jgi:cellulose synthase operon protein YhjQ
MSIIGVISMKGGVGKTSVTANLASALAGKLGESRVTAIDLDPQNGLQWHFGLEAQDSDGVCEISVRSEPWRRGDLPSGFDVDCMPYGAGVEKDRETFEALLEREPEWLGTQIKRSDLTKDAVVLIDSPPGVSVYQKQIFACADLILVVVLADAGSYATIPAMETCLDEMEKRYPNLRSAYVLNQIDRSKSLNRDVADLLQRYLGDRLVPVGIHADSAVGEALAFHQPVLVYDPHGQASHDLDRLASWVIEALNQ